MVELYTIYPQKECTCGKVFQAKSANQEYCDRVCRDRAYRHRSKGTATPRELRERRVLLEVSTDHLDAGQKLRLEEERERAKRELSGPTSADMIRDIGYVPRGVPDGMEVPMLTWKDRIQGTILNREEMEAEKAKGIGKGKGLTKLEDL